MTTTRREAIVSIVTAAVGVTLTKLPTSVPLQSDYGVYTVITELQGEFDIFPTLFPTLKRQPITFTVNFVFDDDDSNGDSKRVTCDAT